MELSVRLRTLAFAFALALAAITAAPAGARAATLDGVSPVPSGVSKARSWIVSSGNHPVVRGSRGVVIRGRAYAPSRAPYQVKLVIWSANQIRHKPYKWGGGHGTWNDSGYDCSGSVSYALHGAHLISRPMDSTEFMSWARSGPGKWVTVYANSGHAFMMVAGLRFDTGYHDRYGADHGAKPG